MQENLDYLIFIAGTIVVFATLAFLLPRWRTRAKFPVPVLVLSALMLGANWWFVQNAGEEEENHIERIVQALAPTYAIELEQLGHELVTTNTAPDDPRYLAIVSRIRSWERISGFAHDIYTIRKLPNGKPIFIVDPETDYDHNGVINSEREQRTPIGTPVEEVDSGLDVALGGIPNFSREIVRDQWGQWVGAWAPIRGSDGKVEAAVGVDFSAEAWLAAQAGARRLAIVWVAMVMALLAVGGSAFALLKADNVARREAEAHARRMEARMALTLQRMPLAFVEFNAAGECISWNPTAERIFGYPAERMIGHAILPLIVAPSAREHAEKMWSQLMQQRGGSHSINDNVTSDGRTIICEWFNTAITDAAGKITGVFSLGQEITERVNLEKHIQQAQRLNAVGQLAAGVAHDFNNILTIITGHAGLVLDHAQLPPDARPDLERIEDAALRASGLTRQLLAFSRQQAMFPRPLHLADVVESTATMLARVLGDDVTFSARIEPDVPAIEADPAMMDQVITNLVLNARDALPRGGMIEISLQRALVDEATLRLYPEASLGECVCLAVRDTGTGIPSENLSRLFEPFFTTKSTGRGTGLGLSVVHGIVKQHHGWIDVQSELGQGTTFRLFFPATTKVPAAGAATPAEPEMPADPRRRKTILLAEDEAIVRDLARMILERAGYNVLDAPDGIEALKLWAEHHESIDILVTDMVMPNGITGRELAQRLLADRPDLPVVYASGYSLELTAPDFRETERQIFLQKPYLTEQLVATVKRCLHESTGGGSNVVEMAA